MKAGDDVGVDWRIDAGRCVVQDVENLRKSTEVLTVARMYKKTSPLMLIR